MRGNNGYLTMHNNVQIRMSYQLIFWNESLTLSMYHAAVHDARNNTLILVIQSQCYTLHSATRCTYYQYQSQ